MNAKTPVTYISQRGTRRDMTAAADALRQLDGFENVKVSRSRSERGGWLVTARLDGHQGEVWRGQGFDARESYTRPYVPQDRVFGKNTMVMVLSFAKEYHSDPEKLTPSVMHNPGRVVACNGDSVMVVWPGGVRIGFPAMFLERANKRG